MYTMFSLCWLLTLLCHVLNEKGAFFAQVSSVIAWSLLPAAPTLGGPVPVSACVPPPNITPPPNWFLKSLDLGNTHDPCPEQ
jgi:hypothetical protein